METIPRDGGLDRRILHNIHFQARRMAHSHVRAGMAVEDYEQELLVDLLHRRRSFDPARASFRTFADRVVTHRVSTLALLTLRAEAERRLISLDAAPDHVDDNDEALVERLRDPAAPLEDQMAIGIDVRRFVAALPGPLLQACALALADNIAKGARDARISRSTAHERIAAVRRKALTSGLATGLPGAADRFAAYSVCGRDAPRSGRLVTAMPNKPPRIHLLVSESELRAWLAHAAPGDRLEYHRGVLAADRIALGSRLPISDSAQLNRIADLVFNLAAAGRVHLLQRRNGPADYTYIVLAGSSLAAPAHCHAGDRP